MGISFTSSVWWRAHLKSVSSLSCGHVVPSDVEKECTCMKDKQKMRFPQNVHHINLNIRTVCFVLVRLDAAVHRGVSRVPVWLPASYTPGGRIEGGWVRSESEKVQIQASSLHWSAQGVFIAVSRRLERQGRGGEDEERGLDSGTARCLSYCIIWLSLSLFVCLSSHCRNQFALCGTVDKERERLPGGLAQKKCQQTQTERQKPGLPSWEPKPDQLRAWLEPHEFKAGRPYQRLTGWMAAASMWKCYWSCMVHGWSWHVKAWVFWQNKNLTQKTNQINSMP